MAYFYQLENLELGGLSQISKMGKRNSQFYYYHGVYQLCFKGKKLCLNWVKGFLFRFKIEKFENLGDIRKEKLLNSNFRVYFFKSNKDKTF